MYRSRLRVGQIGQRLYRQAGLQKSVIKLWMERAAGAWAPCTASSPEGGLGQLLSGPLVTLLRLS